MTSLDFPPLPILPFSKIPKNVKKWQFFLKTPKFLKTTLCAHTPPNQNRQLIGTNPFSLKLGPGENLTADFGFNWS